MVTLKEIAEMCGVATSTVSNVINNRPKVSEETRKRVLDAIESTGYQPNFFAQGIRKLKTNVIGIITEDLNEFSSALIVESIMGFFEAYNYRTILINLRIYQKWKDFQYNDPEVLKTVLDPALREFLSIKVDGIIYIAGHCRHIKCFPDDLSIPGVMVYGISENRRFPSIVLDDEQGGYEITHHLASMGHTRIGVIAGHESNIHAKQRLLGYQRALFENHLLYDPTLIRFGDWERESGYHLIKSLLDQQITAVFCMNDRMAGGVYDYLYENNIEVVKDLSVTGYDNAQMSDFVRPHLTTVDMQLPFVGEYAANMMLDFLKSDDWTSITLPPDSIVKIPSKLVIRDSVKKMDENE